MWFKNLFLFRLQNKFTLSQEALEAKLADHRLKPCGKLEMNTIGWTSPIGRNDEQLCFSNNQCLLICAGANEKIIPPIVVKEALADRLEAIEAKEGKIPGRKIRQQLQDEILLELMPQAFTRPKRTFAYIDTQSGWLVVDSSSAKTAEELVSLIRQSLGSFKVNLADEGHTPSILFTDWLSTQSTPSAFEFGDECELKHEREGALVTCRKQEITAHEITEHLNAGKQVTKIGLLFENRIEFLLTDELSIRKLKFLDCVIEQLEDVPAEDKLQELDVQFAVMNLELRRLFEHLNNLFPKK